MTRSALREAAIEDALHLVTGYKAPIGSDQPRKRPAWTYSDVSDLAGLCGFVRARVMTVCPDVDWHDRFTWYLIRDVLRGVDDSQVAERKYLVVAKHLLACGESYTDLTSIPNVFDKDGRQLTLADVRKVSGKSKSYETDPELRRLFCARIVGGNVNVFKRFDRNSHARAAGSALVDALTAAIAEGGYLQSRFDGYGKRLDDEQHAASASQTTELKTREFTIEADADPSSRSSAPPTDRWVVRKLVRRHPIKTCAALIAVIALAASLTAIFRYNDAPSGEAADGMVTVRSADGRSQPDGPSTPTASQPPPPATFRDSPAHVCRNPNPSTEPNERPEICVIAWCMGDVFTSEGEVNAANIFVKIRPGIFNTSPVPLDISITGVSAMRLLISEADMPKSWNPPPSTAAANDRPILVEWEGSEFWAVSPNIPTEYIPIVKSVDDGLFRYARFATKWNDEILERGGSRYKTIVQGSSNPDDVVQESDLVFEIPRFSDIYGLAIIRRNRPTDVLSVSKAGRDAELWPPARAPASF